MMLMVFKAYQKPYKLIKKSNFRGVKILQNTFIHIPGIGKETEANLWKNNVHTWNQLLEINLSETIHSFAKQSIKAYEEKNYDFFLQHLPSNQHWRAYDDFRDQCCFLDIETTGLSKYTNDITLVGLYANNESKFFIQGKNMKELPKYLNKYPMIITYNGKCFDLPFLQHKFPSLNLNKYHIDLRFAMKDIGYSGGLKSIERQAGIQRDDDLKEVDGYEAVRLWYKYKRGDSEALGTLLRYNQADIENLKILMDLTFDKLKNKEFYSLI